MNRKTIFFSFICLLLLSANAQTASIKHIYEVTLPVVSQDKQIRQAAFEQAFIEVSMRVSGTSLAPTQLSLKIAHRLVSQYRYKAMSRQEIDAYVKESSSLVPPKYKLWVQFDDGKVKKQLRDNGLPIWGYQRPNVLIWLAVKDGRNRYLLKKSDRSQIKDAVNEEARRRGLPLIWPEYDVQDKKQVKFIDVWGEFLEPVKQASKRYPVDAVILGRMNWEKNGWKINWSLLMEDKVESWQLSAVDLTLLMNSGVGVATDHISSRFAVFEDSANDAELMVRVNDLNDVKRYSKVAHYLSSLAPVKNVYVSQVNKYQIDFHIELNGDENDLKRIIALGKVLVPDTRPQVKVEIEQPVMQPVVENQSEISPPPPTIITKKEPQNVLRYRLKG